MKYLLLIVNDENLWLELSESEQQEQIDRMNAYDAKLKAAGVQVSCGGLAPSSMAKTVTLIHDGTSVRDGVAFSSRDNELVTGFFIIETTTEDEALDWAQKMPLIGGSIEVRPIAME